jgi:glucokinase
VLTDPCWTRQVPSRSAIGIDLGATKIYSVLLEGNDVVAEAKGKTPVQGGPLAVVDAVRKLVDSLGAPKRARIVGIGVPGNVDADRTTVRFAPNLSGWVGPFDLGAALSDALDGRTVVVENDVNVGTYAEHRAGVAQGVPDVLGVFVGTGVGGGLILGGELRRGPTGMAAEIGHVVVRPDGRACRCGGRGHLEVYAGRASMERRARTLESRGRDTMLVDLAPARRMTSSVFAKALAAGDLLAIELVDEAVASLGIAIANAVTLLDVPMVVLGGGLADRLGPAFVGRVEQAARSRVYRDNPARVVPTALGDRGGAVGAALFAAEAVATAAP